MIEISDLHVDDDRSAPARGVSLRVAEGEIVGLLGPRGSGKSAVMKVLATLRPARSGRALLAGYDVATQPTEVCRAIGYLPDFSGIYDDMRVGELMRFYARVHHVEGTAAQVQIEKLLGLAGLADRKEEPILKLEREQKQRLGVAKTLIHEPKVLLLDDPAMGLEPPARDRLALMIRAINAQTGCTILFGTNLLSDVTGVCARVAVMMQGRKLEEGPTAAIAEKVTTGRMIEVRARKREDADALQMGLRADGRVMQAELHGEGVVFNLKHGMDRPGDVIADLAAQGFPVAAWREHGINLGMLLEPAGV